MANAGGFVDDLGQWVNWADIFPDTGGGNTSPADNGGIDDLLEKYLGDTGTTTTTSEPPYGTSPVNYDAEGNQYVWIFDDYDQTGKWVASGGYNPSYDTRAQSTTVTNPYNPNAPSGSSWQPNFNDPDPWAGMPADYAGKDTFVPTVVNPTPPWGSETGIDYSPQPYTDANGNIYSWNRVTGNYERTGYDPNMLASQPMSASDRAALEQRQRELEAEERYRQQQLEYQRQQDLWNQQYQQGRLDWEKEQFAQQQAAEKESRLANLRANPQSWLEYNILAGSTPAVQPWMMPLMPQQYSSLRAGSAMPGWNAQTNAGGVSTSTVGAPTTATATQADILLPTPTASSTGVFAPTATAQTTSTPRLALSTDSLTLPVPSETPASPFAPTGQVAFNPGPALWVEPPLTTGPTAPNTPTAVFNPSPKLEVEGEPGGPVGMQPVPNPSTGVFQPTSGVTNKPSPYKSTPELWVEPPLTTQPPSLWVEGEPPGTGMQPSPVPSRGIFQPTGVINKTFPYQPTSATYSPNGTTPVQGATGNVPDRMPTLLNPSMQYWTRMGPTSQAQYLGYQQMNTGAPPAETQFRLWNSAPPSGSNRGLYYGR